MFLFGLCLTVICYYAGTCVTSPENNGNDVVTQHTTDQVSLSFFIVVHNIMYNDFKQM